MRFSWIWFLVPLVVGLHILTLPDHIIGGDNSSIRMVAIHLVQEGEFGIPFARKSEMHPDFFNIKNQMFIENEERQRLFSRWGEMNTLLFAIPEWIRQPKDLDARADFVGYSNSLNIVFSALITLYLILLGRVFRAPSWAIALCSMSTLFATIVFTYMRMQSYEIFQMLFFGMYFYHFTTALRLKSWRHLLIAQLVFVALIHVKVFFMLLLLPSIGALWMTRKRIPKPMYFSMTLAGAALAYLSHQWVAIYKFGQLTWLGDAPGIEGFSGLNWLLEYIPYRIRDYTIGAKASLALYCPTLIFAVPFIPGLLQRFRVEGAFLLLSFFTTLVVLLNFSTHGEWCVGPRYWAFMLPYLALPLAAGLPQVARCAQMTLILLLLVVTSISGFFNYHLASRPYFMRHYLVAFVVNARTDRSDLRDYLDQANDYAIFYRYNRFISDREAFPPIEAMLDDLPEAQRLGSRNSLAAGLTAFFPCNFRYKFLCPR